MKIICGRLPEQFTKGLSECCSYFHDWKLHLMAENRDHFKRVRSNRRTYAGTIRFPAKSAVRRRACKMRNKVNAQSIRDMIDANLRDIS